MSNHYVFGQSSTARKAEGIAQFQHFSSFLGQAPCGSSFHCARVICLEDAEFTVSIFPSGDASWHVFAIAVSVNSNVTCKYKIDIMRDAVSVATWATQTPTDFNEGQYLLSALEPMSYPTHKDLVNAYYARLKHFEREGWISNDALTIKLSVEAVVGGPESTKPGSALRPVEGVNLLQSDMRRLLQDGTGADVKLLASDGVVPAHRLLLATRSPVFRSMFEAKSEEVATVSCNVDSSSLRAFLHYVYCGTLPQDVARPWVVMRLAHTYEVPSLVDECVAKLQQNLTPENAASLLMEADCCGMESLKAGTMDYIVSKSSVFREVLQSEGYKALPATLLQAILAREMEKIKPKQGAKMSTTTTTTPDETRELDTTTTTF
jgi:hypothetical protein